MCACSLSDFKRGGLTSNLQHNLDASVNGSNGFAEEEMIVGVLLGCVFSLNNHTQLLRCMTDRYECLMRKPQLVELSVPYLATKTSAAQKALRKHRSPETQVKSQQPRTAVSWEMIWACYFITLLCSQKSPFHNIHWNAHLFIPLVQQIGSTHAGPSQFVCTCGSVEQWIEAREREWVSHHKGLFEKALEDKRQEQQQAVDMWQTGGRAGHVAVITVAAVNGDAWCSVALTVGLAAERLVGARLHHPAWHTRWGER